MFAGVLLVIAVTACSASEPASPAVVTKYPPKVAPGQPVAAIGKPVLTIIDGDRRMTFDLQGLEQLGLAESRLFEPYVKQDITFEGVPFQDVVDYLGLRREDQIHAVAIDNYDVTIGVGDLVDSQTLVATRSGGNAIPIADGGATRLVFPGKPLAADMNQWIWSLDTITILRH